MVPKIHGSKNSWSGKFHFLKNYWFQTRKFKFKFIGSIIVLGVACAMWVVCYVISMLILGFCYTNCSMIKNSMMKIT